MRGRDVASPAVHPSTTSRLHPHTTSSPSPHQDPKIAPADQRRYVLELAWAFLGDELDASHVDRAVRVALPGDASDGSDGPSLAASTTADVLWLVSCEVEMQPERRAKVVDLAKALCDGDDALCAPGLLIERCEGEFLEECGLIPSAMGWKKKEVRINTRLVYTQNKFNLLREESEGYSKLVVALAAFGERGSGDDDAVAGAIRSTQARSVSSHRSPCDRVGAVNADP